MKHFDQILERVEPLRSELLKHQLYREMGSLRHLQIFMENHVFAVWDFMTLLKELQQRLTCVSTLWTPSPDRLPGRLINEIVLCEESDEDGTGSFISHFELYCRAMYACGADLSQIDRFVDNLTLGMSFERAVGDIQIYANTREFVAKTVSTAVHGQLCQVAAAFTFGREELLPDVFGRLVDDINLIQGGSLDDFKYYLRRHIEVDGDDHGPMARQMLEHICGTDKHKWECAEQSAVESLRTRIHLWDGILKQVRLSDSDGDASSVAGDPALRDSAVHLAWLHGMSVDEIKAQTHMNDNEVHSVLSHRTNP